MLNKQYSMNIYPTDRGRDVYRNIEICGNSTLKQLCEVILETFHFVDEHLYEFVWITACIVKTQNSQIMKEMNLQLMLNWMKVDFVKVKNSHFIMFLEMIGCS